MFTRRLPLATLLITLVACDSKVPSTSSSGPSESSGPTAAAPSEPAPRELSGEITAKEGGRVGDAGSASVTVPPGGVKKDVLIQLRSSSPDTYVAPDVCVVGQVWSFKVNRSDRFRFSKPVRIAVPYDASRLIAGVPVVLSVWQTNRWRSVPGSRVEGNMVVADVSHFSDYAPTQEVPSQTPDSAENVRKRFMNTEAWYGDVHISIRGSGSLTEGEYTTTYSISRVATVKFKIPVNEGELATAAAMEEVTRKFPGAVPPEQKAQLEKLRNVRHWSTPPSGRTDEFQDDYCLEIADRFDSTEDIAPGGEGSSRVNRVPIWRSGRCSGGGRDGGSHRLEIDAARGTYSLSVQQFKAGTLKSSSKPFGRAPEHRSEGDGLVGWDLKNQELPKSGGVIAGMMRIPAADFSKYIPDPGQWSFNYGTTSGMITWTLSPVPLDDVELVITPDNYDVWLPRGGEDSKTRGNSITMKAWIRKRGGGDTKAKLQSLVVRVVDVSSEPGVCLNKPLTGGEETPDLKFSPTCDGTIEDDGLRVRKDGEFTSMALEVDCFDWGAWGAVKAMGILTDGRPLWATLDGDPSQDEIRLPKRDDDCKVATKWKSDVGASGCKDDEDAEKQQGNGHHGDGLTLYEEYRGLIAKGKHTRDHEAGSDGAKPLTLKKKDLVVWNKFKSDSLIRKGLDLFEKASGIHVVEVDDGELPASRQVNMNRGKISVTAQHGLLLEDASAPGALGFSEFKRGPRLEPDRTVSPKGYVRVTVSLQAERGDYAAFVRYVAAEGYKVPEKLEDSIATTVAHELAHGLGVRHHGTGGYAYAGVTEVTAAMKEWSLYDRDGRLITVRPCPVSNESSFGTGTAGVGAPGNASSGDVDCIGGYVNTYAWSYYDRARTLYAMPFSRSGKKFCTSAAGTGYNAQRTAPDGKTKLPGVFGDADKGDCLGQMCVRDP